MDTDLKIQIPDIPGVWLHLDVDLLNEAGVGDHLIPVDTVHQWFCEGNFSDAGHVESVDIVPPGNHVILVLPVFNPAHVQSCFVWEHEPTLSQPLVSGVEHCVQHGLVEQAVAHPLRDDDVHLLNASRQLDLLNLAPDDSDGVTQAIVRHNLLGVIHYRAHVYTNHLSSSSFGSKHREDSSSTANIQDDLALEQVL